MAGPSRETTEHAREWVERQFMSSRTGRGVRLTPLLTVWHTRVGCHDDPPLHSSGQLLELMLLLSSDGHDPLLARLPGHRGLRRDECRTEHLTGRDRSGVHLCVRCGSLRSYRLRLRDVLEDAPPLRTRCRWGAGQPTEQDRTVKTGCRETNLEQLALRSRASILVHHRFPEPDARPLPLGVTRTTRVLPRGSLSARGVALVLDPHAPTRPALRAWQCRTLHAQTINLPSALR
jgi:hypothetical protein